MDKDKLQINLTGRPPVIIVPDDWPLITESYRTESEGERGEPRLRTTEAFIRVRKHADGRKIVYGRYEHSSAYHEPNRTVYAGYVLDPDDDVIPAIEAVGAELADSQVPNDELLDGAIDDLVREAIAGLPAVELV